MNCASACGLSAGNCNVSYGNAKQSLFIRILKPFLSFVISVLLVLSMSHITEKYATTNSFEEIKTELHNLRKEVRSIRESRDEIKEKLKDITCILPKLSEMIEQLRKEISEGVEANIRRIVESELEIYDADKTGRADYALESLGGSILSTRNTVLYNTDESRIPFLTSENNCATAIIQPTRLPGDCWAIKGSEGAVAIKLIASIPVSGFSLEHIPASISPTKETSNAPKDFSVWGLYDPDDTNGYLLGRSTYNNAGRTVQYFQANNPANRTFEIVELRIHSNSGHPNYTCIYRLRVHAD